MASRVPVWLVNRLRPVLSRDHRPPNIPDLAAVKTIPHTSVHHPDHIGVVVQHYYFYCQLPVFEFYDTPKVRVDCINLEARTSFDNVTVLLSPSSTSRLTLLQTVSGYFSVYVGTPVRLPPPPPPPNTQPIMLNIDLHLLACQQCAYGSRRFVPFFLSMGPPLPSKMSELQRAAAKQALTGTNSIDTMSHAYYHQPHCLDHVRRAKR